MLVTMIRLATQKADMPNPDILSYALFVVPSALACYNWAHTWLMTFPLAVLALLETLVLILKSTISEGTY
jgi:hypothetical protein